MHLTVSTATFMPEFQYQIKGDGVMWRLLDEDDVLNAVDQRIQELQSHPEFRRKHADIDLYGIKEYIRQIPTAQQWIPCSERLPKNDKDVLITCECGDVEVGWYDGEWNGECCVYDDDDIIAWMPLPEPWNGEQNEQT